MKKDFYKSIEDLQPYYFKVFCEFLEHFYRITFFDFLGCDSAYRDFLTSDFSCFMRSDVESFIRSVVRNSGVADD